MILFFRFQVSLLFLEILLLSAQGMKFVLITFNQAHLKLHYFREMVVSAICTHASALLACLL